MSSISSNRKIQFVAVAIFFAAATVPMFYPISVNMGTMITDKYDGLLQTWMMLWNVHAWTTPAEVWNANMFWPHPDALAYSDHMIGAAIIAAPFYLITDNPIFAHNIFTYLSFVIGGLGMFLLVRRLTGNAAAGIVAGVIFAYCPWRMGRVGPETNLLANHWMPWALLYLHRVLDDDAAWWEIPLLGFFVFMLSLGSFYHAAMAAMIILTVVIVRLIAARGRFSAKVWVKLVGGGVIAFILLLPTVLPFYRVAESQGTVRTIEETMNLAADPVDYLRAAPWNRMWGKVTTRFENRRSRFPGENRLFPGLTVVLLAIAGLFASKPRDWEPDKKAYLWAAIVCFLLSLGPYLQIFWHQTRIPLPYLAVYHYVPGFGALRGTARFAMAVETELAVVAAFGFTYLFDKIKNKRNRALWTVGIVAVLFAEFFSSPVPHNRVAVGEEIPDVYKWLAAREGDFPIVELPQIPDFTWLPEETRYLEDSVGFKYMYFSTYHWKDMVNGRSSFIPRTNEHLFMLLTDFPSTKLVNILRYHGVEYVVMHSEGYYWETPSSQKRRVAETDKLLERAAEFGPDIVYKIPDPIEDEARRAWWTELDASGFFAPGKIKPGALFNLEIRLSGKDEQMPVYSFELVEYEAKAKIEGAGGTSEQVISQEDFVLIDPGESQWTSFTFQAPDNPGEYEWTVAVTLAGHGDLCKGIRFRQTVGEYPDSGDPGLLKATFIELELPRTLVAGEKFPITARLRNDGDTLWRAHRFNGRKSYKGVVMLAIRDWRNAEGKPLELWKNGIAYCMRAALEKSVPPGSETEVSMESRAPDIPGKYEIIIQMVDEHILWFEDSGGEKKIVEVEVIEP